MTMTKPAVHWRSCGGSQTAGRDELCGVGYVSAPGLTWASVVSVAADDGQWLAPMDAVGLQDSVVDARGDQGAAVISAVPADGV